MINCECESLKKLREQWIELDTLGEECKSYALDFANQDPGNRDVFLGNGLQERINQFRELSSNYLDEILSSLKVGSLKLKNIKGKEVSLKRAIRVSILYAFIGKIPEYTTVCSECEKPVKSVDLTDYGVLIAEED